MSTGSTLESSLPLEIDSPKQHAPQSALYYLSQEASKFACPAHHGFKEGHSPWTDCVEDKMSLNCSSEFIPKMKTAQNPLKLLNLINQQCERLLNQNEDEEQGSLIISDLGNSNASLSLKAVEAFQEAAQSLNNERDHVRKADSSPEDPNVYPGKAQVTENPRTIQPERSEDTMDVPQTSELKFNVALGLSSDWTKECLSTQCTFYDFLPHPKEASTDELLTFRSNDTEPLLPLDHNGNICVNPGDTVNSILESAECYKFCNSFQQQHSNIQVNMASTCEDSSEETAKPGAENKLVLSASLEKDSGVQCSTWRSTRRKQLCPSRSASVQDPDFQGVTFRMDTEMDDSKEQCRLLITSKYSSDLPKNVKRTRLRTKMAQKFPKTSSDEDSDSATSDIKSKVCASCCTRKTPMWRDAEDGTPLCNACGIRYKKYRVRCANCWHIPKKDGNSESHCGKCGHFVKLTLSQRRPTV